MSSPGRRSPRLHPDAFANPLELGKAMGLPSYSTAEAIAEKVAKTKKRRSPSPARKSKNPQKRLAQGKSASPGKGSVRHKRLLKDNMTAALRQPRIRRIARRAGVKRINGKIYEEVRGVAKLAIESLLNDIAIFVEHAKRRTVNPADVVNALKRHGTILYGYGPSV